MYDPANVLHGVRDAVGNMVLVVVLFLRMFLARMRSCLLLCVLVSMMLGVMGRALRSALRLLRLVIVDAVLGEGSRRNGKCVRRSSPERRRA